MTQEDEHCLLWAGGKAKGEQKGLIMDPLCPVERLCTGEVCVYLAPKEVAPVQTQTQKFRTRLEKHFTKI